MAALNFKYKHHFDPKTPGVRDFGPDFDFMGVFLDGLNTACARRSEDDLGDRSTYIGASDLNSNCIRKTVLEKRNALNPKKIDFQQGIYYERGHLAEHILRKLLLVPACHNIQYLLTFFLCEFNSQPSSPHQGVICLFYSIGNFLIFNLHCFLDIIRFKLYLFLSNDHVNLVNGCKEDIFDTAGFSNVDQEPAIDVSICNILKKQ